MPNLGIAHISCDFTSTGTIGMPNTLQAGQDDRSLPVAFRAKLPKSTGRLFSDFGVRRPFADSAARVPVNGDTSGFGRRGEFRFVADVLLHEMIHQWQQEITGIAENSYHCHGRTIRDKCNEIGSKVGLRPVGLKTSVGLPPCSSWPHNVRHNDFYLGAIVLGSAKTPQSEHGSGDPVSAAPQLIANRTSLSEVEAIARYARRVLEPGEIQDLVRLLEF